MWGRAAYQPTRRHLAVLDDGVRLFPRRSQLVYRTAALYTDQGFTTEATDLIRLSLLVATGDAERERFTQLQTQLAAAAPAPIRSRLMQIEPYGFEKFLRLMMEKDGFTDVSVTKASGDGGIDLNAYVDESNVFFAGTHVQVQAKRWRHSVGSVELNMFRGALSSTAKGVFVTTSHFTRAAVAEAKHISKPSITLVDGLRLSGIVRRLELAIS